MMEFVPLQVLSSYSLLNSTTKIDQLVSAAKQRGYRSLALTDEDVLYGAVEFYNAARQADIHPIIGLTLRMNSVAEEGVTVPIVLLAKDWQGYQNLMKLSTLQNTGDEKTRLTYSQVKPMLAHVFVIHPTNGDVYRLVQQGNSDQARDLLVQWQSDADEQSVLIGVNPYTDPILRQSIHQLVDATHTEEVALNRVGYLNADDHFAVEVLRSIDQGSKFQQPESLAHQLGTHYLRDMTTEVAAYEAAQLSKAVYRTQQVAEQCQVVFTFQPPVLPAFPTTNGQDSQHYLRQLCLSGLKQRTLAPGITVTDYTQRLAKELKVIHEMGFDDYFLIVWDVMRFAHDQGITTGPGRGSAAGSLVAYALAITDVDPLQYQLLFERFLNPQRAQMPDIDLDLPDNRRGEVLQYVHDKYGHTQVAQIITFGTLAAKQVIRDVGRVFGLSQSELSAWSAAVPNQLHIALNQAYQDSMGLRTLVGETTKNQLLYQVAQRLEGLPRHYSTHAAGIVLSDEPLINVVPLQDGGEGLLMTQFTKDTVESLGLLKMDFLGLRNLTIVAQTMAIIQRETPEFSLAQISLADEETLQLFQQGDTNGIFQFESNGIKNVLVSLHPDNFELIVAVNALYRPGPMENIDHFIKRKNGQEPVTYPDESLKPILGVTYGILVYQEQVLQVASQLAGFSLGEADLLRRAMSKKKQAVMDEMQDKFIAGAQTMGHSRAVAEQVFDYIDQFARYGFNRSHAVAYSKMAFQMAYLKTHFPEAFFTALLNSVANNPAKIKGYLAEIKKRRVKVIGPDINRSEAQFSFHGDAIIFGLSVIKGMRRDFVEAIVNERTSNGPFEDLLSFIQRMDTKWRKKEILEPLIYTGAFDGLGYNRAELIEALTGLLDSVELTGASLSLFKELKPTIAERTEFSLTKRLTFEEQYLGAYLSGHPVDQYTDLAHQLGTTMIAELRENMTVTMIIFVGHVKVIRTKRGDQMAFVSGSDQSGTVDITVFPKLFKRVQQLLDQDQIIVVRGRVELNRGLQIVAASIEAAQQLAVKYHQSTANVQTAKRWVLRIDAKHQNQEVQTRLHEFIRQHQGPIPVILFNPVTDRKVIQPKNQWLVDSTQIIGDLVKIIGTNNAVLQNLNNTAQ